MIDILWRMAYTRYACDSAADAGVAICGLAAVSDCDCRLHAAYALWSIYLN